MSHLEIAIETIENDITSNKEGLARKLKQLIREAQSSLEQLEKTGTMGGVARVLVSFSTDIVEQQCELKGLLEGRRALDYLAKKAQV